MSHSRHFANASLRRTRSANRSNVQVSTFGSEIDKFDREIKTNLIKLEEEEEHEQRCGARLDVKSNGAAKRPQKRIRKHIKLESEAEKDDDVSDPQIPDNFFPIYNRIKEMRRLITTPVDLIGCVKIPALLKLITTEYLETGKIKTIEIDEIPDLKKQLELIETPDTDRISRFYLLVTLLFSSQTKDEVNFQVMQSLHHHYLKNGYKEGLCIQGVLDTDEKDLDKMIFKIGFHSRKATYLKETALTLHERFDDDIPDSIEELVKLKGIGYKMGHLILQGAWNQVVGISVDTHMVRLCNMFGWVPKNEKNPDNIRKALEEMLAQHKELWNEINPVLVGFGQSVCTPTGRRCDLCLLSKINEKNDYLCPAVDKKLLLRIKRGVEKDDRKIRGDLKKLVDYINS